MNACESQLWSVEDDICYSSLLETKRRIEEKISKCKPGAE